MLALASAMFTVQGLTQLSRSQARIAALESNVRSLGARIAADEHTATADRRHVNTVVTQATGTARAVNHLNWELTSVPTEAEVAHMRGELAVYNACLPELNRDVDRLAITWKINPTRPSMDYFKPFSSAPMSAACSAALAGR